MGVKEYDMDARDSKYERAKKRVKEIKGWYNHLAVYLIVNTVLQFFYAGFFDDGTITGHFPYWVKFTTPFFWGISVVIHGLYVYKGHFFRRFYKNWEARKIKELMEDEDALLSKKSKWE